ncbi:MAG: hypothetical protein CBC35_05785 [Planctomycetes bacterium TMED75]|nr:hypothetical protein [Planctomycetaceae bacterium]OUU93325.1 MAG: hypothetical protein CBC35_05785 [Planctomycetes bacterium TMED75]
MTKNLSDRELLRHLVSYDTTSDRSPASLFDFVCDYLGDSSIRTTRMDCGDGYENVLFESGPPSRNGEGWMLCGHVDTVPAEEPDWLSDPLELVERSGRLHARGACDMKGFNAIAMNFLRLRAHQGFDHPLGLLLTHSEEVGTIGAGHFARDWPRERMLPRNVIVGEPTSLKPVRGHKGHLSFRITLTGRPCHTGFPAEGMNAIELALPMLKCLKGLREQLVDERTAESSLFPLVPHPVLNVVRVAGGSAVNVMPASCVLDVGARLLPGQSSDEFLPRLHRLIAAAGIPCSDSPLEGHYSLEVINETPSFSTAADEAFLQEVCSISGHPEAIGVNYGTDAGRLKPLGCRCVIFGPGDIAQAHRANEWIPIDEFERMPHLLGALIDTKH